MNSIATSMCTGYEVDHRMKTSPSQTLCRIPCLRFLVAGFSSMDKRGEMSREVNESLPKP
jgi:hypothetical protein